MRRVRLLYLTLALVLPGSKLSATLLTPLPVEELGQRAELILLGTVLNQSCERSTEGRIYTRVELHVAEVWKGQVTNAIFTIVHSGGTVGHLRAQVSGQVSYVIGEEVVAFVLRNSRGEGVTLGLAQGKFHVWQDSQTGEKFVHNIFHGATEYVPKAGKENSERLGLKSLARRVKANSP
jgi:hypothetical protein